MSSDVLKRTLLFLLFLLAQVVVLGRIHLFNCATPLLYVYFVAMLPRNHPKWASLLWAFSLGLLIDIFSNTPGLAAASLTLVAALQPYLLELFVPRDAIDDLQPSMVTLGPTKFTYYIHILVLMHCLVFFSLEMFSFFHLMQWALCVVGSAAITLVIIYAFEIATSNH